MLKETKISELNTDYLFCSVAIEAMGPICSAGRLFLAKLGRCAKFLTCDPRETDYFFQRVGVCGSSAPALPVHAGQLLSIMCLPR
mgnify:CR=1 FL=1